MILVYIGTAVAVLLGLLLWSTGRGGTGKKPAGPPVSLNLACEHLHYLSQIRQALDRNDYAYLEEKSGAKIRQVRRERRRVALEYLACLYEDFDRLMDTAQVIAAHSPEVVAKEEWKRFKLATEFRAKYRLARFMFLLGSASFGPLEGLANLVSSLELELEKVVNEISLAALGTIAERSAKY